MMAGQHVRTSVRRKGVRLTKKERQAAQEKFLKAFANTANVRASCLAAGVDRGAVRQWEEHDEAFSQRYAAAKLDADDALRAVIWKRAVTGWQEPVVANGKIARDDNGQILMIEKHSDTLIALMAKARLSEYKEKSGLEALGGQVTVYVPQKRALEEDLRHDVQSEE